MAYGGGKGGAWGGWPSVAYWKPFWLPWVASWGGLVGPLAGQLAPLGLFRGPALLPEALRQAECPDAAFVQH
eukprot:8581540-Pyramimonas_sp.AAC.2